MSRARLFALFAVTAALQHHGGLPLIHALYLSPPDAAPAACPPHSALSPCPRAHPVLPPAPAPADPSPPLSTARPGTSVSEPGLPPHAPETRASREAEQMPGVRTKATIGVLSTLISYMCVNSFARTQFPEAFIWQDEDREETAWIATSRSWIDRKCCRWLGVCGGTHVRWIAAETDTFGQRPAETPSLHKRTVEAASDGGGDAADEDWDWRRAWTGTTDRPEDWSMDERKLREIPDYVLEYAPLVHLYSGEQFWPCDIAEHLYHTTPALNYTPLQSEHEHATLEHLDELNRWDDARWVFLTSNDDVEARPDWLEGEKNIPTRPPSNPDDDDEEDDARWGHTPGRTPLQGLEDAVDDVKQWFVGAPDDDEPGHLGQQDPASVFSSESGRRVHGGSARSPPPTQQQQQQRPRGSRRHAQSAGKIRGGRSDAPAVLVMVNKGHGIVDAFWFFFYSFNLGNVVLNVRFGNHVGDWEHTAVRFHHGVPKAVFFSEHNFGSAYSYDAVEKLGKRPVIYSAYGTHAMYATPGTHPYILPWGILHDLTDRGPLWDPTLNAHAYTYDYRADVLRASNVTPTAPTHWFHFAGFWGDKFYPLSDKRQYRFAGQYHYVNGPLGPKFKNLERKTICAGPEGSPCVIKNWLVGEEKMGRLHQADVAMRAQRAVDDEAHVVTSSAPGPPEL